MYQDAITDRIAIQFTVYMSHDCVRYTTGRHDGHTLLYSNSKPCSKQETRNRFIGPASFPQLSHSLHTQRTTCPEVRLLTRTLGENDKDAPMGMALRSLRRHFPLRSAVMALAAWVRVDPRPPFGRASWHRQAAHVTPQSPPGTPIPPQRHGPRLLSRATA